MANRRYLFAGAACLLAAALPVSVLAQNAYPDKPIRIIVPLPPGSPVDTIGRKLAESMSAKLGTPVIIDNKPGAALTIGAAEVARAKPDGYTLLLTVAEPLVSAVATMKISYDPQRDFRLISKVAASSTGPLLVASAKVKANNLPDLVKEAKASANPMSYASFGPGSYPQQMMETLAKQTGAKFNEIPYKGSPPALVDAMAGNIDLTFSSIDQAKSQIQAGQIKAIAVASKSALLPNVGTFSEAGFDNFVFRNKPWIGLVGPAGLPDAVAQKLLDAAQAAAKEPSMVSFLTSIGFDAVGGTPAQFQQDYQAEFAVVPDLIRSLGVKPQ
ncbi:MAG: tripartite tricarboxylate transporter substrate binding protein [Variovorax sp.]